MHAISHNLINNTLEETFIRLENPGEQNYCLDTTSQTPEDKGGKGNN